MAVRSGFSFIELQKRVSKDVETFDKHPGSKVKRIVRDGDGVSSLVEDESHVTPRQETRKTTGNSTVFDRLYGNRSTRRGERSSLEEHKTPNPKDSKYSPGGVRHSSGRGS